MGKSIYTYYKERLIEIGGKNKCLYLKNISRKNSYDIGRIFEGREDKVAELLSFLWSGGKDPLSLIRREETHELVGNLGMVEEPETDASTAGSVEEYERAERKRKKKITSDQTKLIESEVAKIKELKREVEEIERETGKYELYIGYPFVFGAIQQGPQKTLIKAPLLLFPVKIDVYDDETVDIRFNAAEKIQINKALILAYAQSKKINIDELETEFDDLSGFRSLLSVIQHLGNARIRIECKASKHIYNYARFKEPDPTKNELSVRYAAVLGRFPISNSVYGDYCVLEKKKLTNDAIDELLRTGGKFGKKRLILLDKIRKSGKPLRARRTPPKSSYIVRMLDFAQSEVVKKVDQMGNMVIYGPPGTGKSQTIVNIITDALCKKKRVLVVSQKKAALDVVFSRLGNLNEKAMYINDESKEKHAFYERCYEAHKRADADHTVNVPSLIEEYAGIQARIDQEEKTLEDIYHLLNDKRPFGLSLSEMYSSSYMLQKNSSEYAAYLRMIEYKNVMALNYKELSDAMFTIKANNIVETYYSFAQAKEKNPIIDCMRPDIEIPTIAEVKARLTEIQKSRKGFFNITKYPYTRQVLAHYALLDNQKTLHAVAKMECRIENPNPLFRGLRSKIVEQRMRETLVAIGEFVKEYDCLLKVMTKDGYISVIDNILRGNTAYIKLVHEALDNYIAQRDISMLLGTLDKNMLDILNFAYEASRNYSNYVEIIDKIPVIRMYHEIIVCEDKLRDELAKIVDYPNITARIYKLKESQLAVSQKICQGMASREYQAMYSGAENAKDYFYQISKDKKHWPIRKMMEVYGSFIFSLFPCWLLSPENVSSLLPLEKNLFDIVIFDEASQVFIESTIPTIYRGKNIVVAGDAKQLRPSATFMKRYLGADIETLDESVQAALEVESLLDLAVSRYTSANLTYHYRSRHQELIDFSNCAFYSGNLQVAPNIYTGRFARPMERYKVDGKWIDRKNIAEAKKVVDIIKDIFATRKHNESIGIITFNSDQQTCIADAIDKEAQKDAAFRVQIAKERTRTDGGEDTGIFVKNLENVQGDERDIIIFSIGYAPNETGRVYTNFGSLSAEGGENRLNVAITRAKSKIIVVTSIEPEDLKVDGSKNQGPKLLRDYLAYVRSVSDGDVANARAILNGMSPADGESAKPTLSSAPSIEEQMKERIEKLGYKVDTGLGNKNSRISLAVYDDSCDTYLVGVELEKDAFAASASAMERDVYKPKFLEGRGWKIIRIWSRDWWLSPARVVRSIINAAEKNRTMGKPPKPAGKSAPIEDSGEE